MENWLVSTTSSPPWACFRFSDVCLIAYWPSSRLPWIALRKATRDSRNVGQLHILLATLCYWLLSICIHECITWQINFSAHSELRSGQICLIAFVVPHTWFGQFCPYRTFECFRFPVALGYLCHGLLSCESLHRYSSNNPFRRWLESSLHSRLRGSGQSRFQNVIADTSACVPYWRSAMWSNVCSYLTLEYDSTEQSNVFEFRGRMKAPYVRMCVHAWVCERANAVVFYNWIIRAWSGNCLLKLNNCFLFWHEPSAFRQRLCFRTEHFLVPRQS